MPAIVKRLTASGLTAVDYSAASLRAAEQYESRDGVYTVSNTYNRTQTLLLGAHLDRLEDSAAREGINLSCQRGRLKSALRGMIIDSEYDDVRFRISVAAATPHELLLSIEPFQPPTPDHVSNGVRCNTTSAVARQNPASKSSQWMQLRSSLEATRSIDIYETFLVDGHGCILEGLSSNFYAIMNGEVYTAGTRRPGGHIAQHCLRHLPEHIALAIGSGPITRYYAIRRSLLEQQQPRPNSGCRNRWPVDR